MEPDSGVEGEGSKKSSRQGPQWSSVAEKVGEFMKLKRKIQTTDNWGEGSKIRMGKLSRVCPCRSRTTGGQSPAA